MLCLDKDSGLKIIMTIILYLLLIFPKSIKIIFKLVFSLEVFLLNLEGFTFLN